MCFPLFKKLYGATLRRIFKKYWTYFFNCCSFTMQVNLKQSYCPTFWNLLHALTAFKSTHTVKPDPQIQLMLWQNTFSLSSRSILVRPGMYSLYLLRIILIKELTKYKNVWCVAMTTVTFQNSPELTFNPIYFVNEFGDPKLCLHLNISFSLSNE